VEIGRATLSIFEGLRSMGFRVFVGDPGEPGAILGGDVSRRAPASPLAARSMPGGSSRSTRA
jgi:hypothetical protein